MMIIKQCIFIAGIMGVGIYNVYYVEKIRVKYLVQKHKVMAKHA